MPAGVANVYLKLVSDSSEWSKNLKTAGSGLRELGQLTSNLGNSWTMGVTAPIVATTGAIVAVGSGFEQAINRLRALTGASKEELSGLHDQAIQLGRDTIFSAKDAADAMGEMAQAGLTVQQIQAGAPAVLQLATAATMDFGTAAETVTNIMNGYRLGVDQLGRANDTLTKAANVTNAEIGDLGVALSYVGPIATAAGADFEEVVAALGELHNAGIMGEMAGTALRGIMSDLLNPTSQAKKALDRLGVSAMDSAGKLRPLADIIADFQKSGVGAADIMKIFGQRAGPAMAALISQGAPALKDLTSNLKNAAGEAKRVADIKMEGFAGAWENLKGTLETLAIGVSESGLLTTLTDFMNDTLIPLFNWFTKLPKPVQQAALNFALVTAAVGPLLRGLGGLLNLIGSITTAWPNLVAAGAALKTAFAGAQSASLWLLGPAGAIAALAAAAATIWTIDIIFAVENWDPAQQAIDKIQDAARKGIKLKPDESMQLAMQSTQTGLKTSADEMSSFKFFWIEAWYEIKDTAISVWTSISDWFKNALPGFTTWWQGVWEAIKQFFVTVWDAIKQASITAWTAISSWFTTALQTFTTWWTTTWDSIKQIVTTAWGAISAWLTSAVQTFLGWWSQQWETAKTNWSTLWNGLKDMASKAWAAVVKWASEAVSTFRDWLTSKWDEIKSAASTAWSAIGDAITSAFSTAITWVKDQIDGLLGFISNIKSRLDSLRGKANQAAPAGPSSNSGPQKPASKSGKGASSYGSGGGGMFDGAQINRMVSSSQKLYDALAPVVRTASGAT